MFTSSSFILSLCPIAIVTIILQTSNVHYTHVYKGKKLGYPTNPNHDDVKAVKVDNSVIVIKWEAFECCSNLTIIEMQNNITEIEPFAFSNCSNLQTITIPISVKKIGRNAFRNCSSLEKVIVSPTTKIHPDAFYNCNNLSYVSKSLIFIGINIPKLSENFEKGAGPKLDFQGATQNGYGPEMWGLTLDQIKAIREKSGIKSDTTMRELVNLVVKPATKGLGIGYALLVNQDKPLRAKVMVSVSYYLFK